MTATRSVRTGARRRRKPTLFLAVALAAAALASVSPIGTDKAWAADDPGVTSRVVGRGDIVTSILGWSRGVRRSGTAARPSCSWRTLNDSQLEWLVSVGAEAVGLGYDTPLLDPLRAQMEGGPLPEGDLQGYVCGVDTHELRFVPTTAPQDLTRRIHRRMITRLPVPDPVISPPQASAVPVGQPVFFWLGPRQWSPVEATLQEGAIIAQVRAWPTTTRIVTGDPASPTVRCDGPGRAFSRDGRRSAASQARLPDACVARYETASGGRSSPRSSEDRTGRTERPETWLGTVTVVWRAQWRVGDGEWMDLGSIPRTRLITRTAREVSTSIESPPD